MANAGRISGFTTDLFDIDTTPQEYLGAIRQDYNKDYKYVKFSGTTAVDGGDFVCYVDPTADPAGPDLEIVPNLVDLVNTEFGAGRAMAAHPAGSATYGWIQIRGLATLEETVQGSPTPGNQVTCHGASAGTLTKVSAATDPGNGQFVRNSPSVLVFLNCNN